MGEQQEWIGIADGVHRAGGLLSYWGLYTMAMQNRIESRRLGRRWLVRRAGLDRYLRELRAGSSEKVTSRGTSSRPAGIGA
jgi:hypothetical protein